MEDRDKEFEYLLEAYKAAVDYFNGYSERYATRFNILLTVDVALAGFFGNALLTAASGSRLPYYLLVVLGLVVSILFYMQSAQDKYILKRQMKRVNDLRVLIERFLGRDDVPALFSPLDETDTGQKGFIFDGLFSWRLNAISLTRIPPLSSVVLIFFWLLALMLIPGS